LRKEFTSFDVAVAVRELKNEILNSRVSNVYQPDKKTLLFKLHKADEPPLNLILEAGKRLHLTSYALEKPTIPPTFCMALRKYIRNAWLISIEQYEFERVVTLNFKSNTGDLQLILELFGDGNVILIGANQKILQALNYKRMRDRNILRQEVFRFAPASGKNPLKVNRQGLEEELKASGNIEVVRVLARHLGVGGTYAEEVLLRAKVEKSKRCETLSQTETDAIFEELQKLLAQASEGTLEPFIVLNGEGDFVDVVPFKLRRYEGTGFKLQPCKSFNEALDESYTKAATVEKALAGLEADQLKREAERLKRIIADQRNVLAEAEANAINNRSVGDTIYAHNVEMQTLLDKFSPNKQKGGDWDSVVSEILAQKKAGLAPGVYFESIDRKTLTTNICVDGLRFGLDLRKSLFENAAGFYERSKRDKQKLEGAITALEGTEKKLAEVEARISRAEALKQVKPTEAVEELAERKVKRKNWFEKFRWFVSSDGLLVVAGKDAVSNEVLIKKHSEPEDVVVVVKTGGRQPSEQVLTEAAEFAASFSRGWREGFASIDVYWVKPEQLSKRGPSGQYVAHGAFVVDGKRNWKRNVPLRVAVGILSGKEEATSFIGGPVDSVKARTQVYVVIAPGDYAGKRLFEHVLGTLSGKMTENDRRSILKASVEKIREFIPFGVGKVLPS
jgi:predicted ribosome quality control (RQC) complex YloA/Tae2 family protein